MKVFQALTKGTFEFVLYISFVFAVGIISNIISIIYAGQPPFETNYTMVGILVAYMIVLFLFVLSYIQNEYLHPDEN